MKLFLDCSNTLVFNMFTSASGPAPIPLMQQAVRQWAQNHIEDAGDDVEIIVWTNSTIKDAAAVAALCFPELEVTCLAPKKFDTPQDGDIVVDDDSDVWGNPEDYPFLAKFEFYTPDDFTARMLA
jgi:hypothetical protein